MSGKKTKECNDFIWFSEISYYELIPKTNQIARNHMKDCKRNNFNNWESDDFILFIARS